MDCPNLETLYYYNKRCNLRCRHCWIEPSFDEAVAGELVLSEVKDLILQGKELGLKSVKLLGGEPLMLPYIRDLIEFLISENVKIMMETNGILIDDTIALLLKNTDPFVSISLDGSNEQIHSILRGNTESFVKAVAGVKRLIANGIRPQIIFCLHAENRTDMDNAIEFARNLGASSIKINFISKMGRARDMTAERLSVADFINIYRSYKGKEDKDFSVMFDIPPAFLSVTSLAQNDNVGTCGIKGIVGVLSNGDISICGIGNIRKDLLLGNVRTHSLESIWKNNEILQSIRGNVPAKLGGICQRCMFKASCMGRCIANTYYATGSLFEGDRFCGEAYESGLFPETRLL